MAAEADTMAAPHLHLIQRLTRLAHCPKPASSVMVAQVMGVEKIS